MPKILIRIDDVCPTMDFGQFEIVLNELSYLGIKPLLGVIPECKDPDLAITPARSDFWEYIKMLESEGCTIAMHGCNHVFDSLGPSIVVSRMDSEFAGLSLDCQIAKITYGKSVMENHGLHTDVFFAPGHSFDNNTIKALAANGFRFMSDGKSRLPYKRFGIKCLPCRSGGIPRKMRGPLQTVVIHIHEWGKAGKEHVHAEFTNFLTIHSKNIVSWQEYSSVESGNNFIQFLSESFFVFCQRIYHLFYKMHIRH